MPREVVDLCHTSGLLVVNMCGKVRHAIEAVEAGCDIVVAQGTEAGGHTGRIATMALVPQVVDAVGDRVPVVAAGGIVDGRGLAAALALGADGVWIGTRFIATPEARSVARLQGRAAAQPRGRHGRHPGLHGQDVPGDRQPATPPSTRTASSQPERFPAQILRSMQDGANHLGGDETTPRGRPRPRVHARPGQGVGAIDGLVPAADLVHRIVDEAESVLAKLRS